MPSAVPTPLPTGTVTFLFTDIEGSTPLWDAHPEAMRAALARHDEILRSAVADAGGQVFSTAGDGYGIVFARVSDAVEAALEAQRRLGAEAWPEPLALRVRMGAHTGEAEERGGDYFGPAVNQAARLMGAAHGGQVVVSGLTAGLLPSGSGVDLVDLGATRLKGIAEPLPVFGVAGPGVEWLDLPLISGQASAGNLPRPTSEFVGDLADLQHRVAGLAQRRVVTLTGSGGVGKTRSAIEVGWLAVDEFVDGVWMVDLGPLTDHESVPAAVASTLGAVPQAGLSVIDSIVDWCLGRRLLLILDNCEHLLDPVVALVSAINRSCATTTVVATSREPLGVAGEVVIRIPSLTTGYARELFLLRARAADSAFVPTVDDDDAITAICERLDGIPLAIELAAARTRSLTPPDLLERLNDRFRLLRGGGRGGLERHQTLRETVHWSYQLLTGPEQVLFDRLSVFAGSFDLAAAEAVTAGGQIDEFDVADRLGSLVDKSMVNVERSDGSMRYRLLETLRQYGEERLDAEETATRRGAHLDHYSAVVARLHQQWVGPDQLEADAGFERDWENIRAAHHWAVLTEDLDRVVALSRHLSGHAWARVRTEFADWSRRALGLLEAHDRCPAAVYNDVAYWTYFDGEMDRAVDIARRGLDDPGDPSGAARCRGNLLFALLSAGRDEEIPPLVEGLRLATASDAVDAESRWLAAFAWAQSDVVRPDRRALARLAEATEELGGPTFRAELVRVTGFARFREDPPDLAGALADVDRAIELSRVASARVSWPETNRAQMMVVAGHPERFAATHRALVTAYDARNWPATEILLELAAHLLAEGGAHDVAATVVGHLELHPPPFGEVGRVFRAATIAQLPVDAATAARRSAGATVDRHQLVADVVVRLADLA